MNRKDAISILKLKAAFTSPSYTYFVYKRAKEQLSNNPASAYLLQLLEHAYQSLKDYQGYIEPNTSNYTEAANQALNAIIDLNLDIEICGSWVWVGGDWQKHKAALLEAGFNLAHIKQRWYLCPGYSERYQSKNWTIDQIRTKYGSNKLSSKNQPLAAA